MTHDYYTYTHSVNVCVIGIALAQKCGVKGEDLKALGSGLLLHDIGKSKIDVTILNKNGPLNGDEWRIIKTHPEVGAKIVKDSRPAKPVTLQIIRQHHEKCTGRGYPLGLVEEEIHLFSKIAALADVYDALTTNRAYKGAADAYPAIHLMQQEMAEDFCPNLFEKLVLLLNIDAKNDAFGYRERGVH
jgi:putative nucleotidyltransferase with HDIG domain